ncbi:hypothetical protein O3G_MSEX009656 [Manduca sexta]|uniref:BTB domain-containing protein n=1 Tax=Manduca sexta TaxID=7130 RepID=A0A922CSG7_MANSE|nr:hypothetical protein O3G_MSEX009656 [Manduca sexta]
MGTVLKRPLLTSMSDQGWFTFEFKYQILEKNNNSDNSYTPKVRLANDMENLLNNGFYSDVTMKSTEGTEFKVHKNILASRSAVLKANFEHNTIECHTNTIESPLEEDVLREVLLYIYSDKVPKINEIPDKLLAAAEYYQLEELKMLCERPLLKRLTVQNAIEILEFADLHSADTLKQETLEFIKHNPMNEIVKTKGWTNIKSVQLVKRICECITCDSVEK